MKVIKFAYLYSKPLGNRTLKIMEKIPGNLLKPGKIMEQDCIPVGCVPPACYPYLPACTGPVVAAPGGCLVQGVSFPGGCLLRGRGGLPASGPGGHVCIPACNGADPPPCEQNYV